jgi:hypothetical protein
MTKALRLQRREFVFYIAAIFPEPALLISLGYYYNILKSENYLVIELYTHQCKNI